MSDSKTKPFSVIAPVARILLAFGLALPASAAVPVEESEASSSQPAETQPRPKFESRSGGYRAAPAREAIDAGTIGGETSRLSELFYQLQVLQQEVQELRGQMEEQSHQLTRLARDQQEQYLDLDRRMQDVRKSAARPGRSSGPSQSGATPAAGAASATEREAYTAAFELMKQRQFQASADAFDQLIVDYPNGSYTPNAFYWLGELYLAQDDTEKARQYFAQVANLYPDHQKVPDALYKLGVIYHRLGDDGRAREYLNRVRSQYPQSSAAGLAQTYLAEL